MRMRLRRTGRASRLLVVCIGLVLLVGGVMVVARRRPESEPIFVPEPVTFAPGLHLLGELSPSVAYVIETSAGLILVDAGLEEHHELLLRQVRQLGLDIRDLKMILVTHGHGDHYLGALLLQQATGAKLYAGRGDSQVIREAGPREAVFSTFAMDGVDIHSTPVDVELVGGETIELGDARIRVLATPGHTPGSVCYLLERRGRTALFSGDTIMSITGDLGTYSTYLAPRYRGDPSAYLATLQELAKLPVPDLLLPGHPRVDQEMVSATISQEDWAARLAEGIAQMKQLVARYAEDGADFLDGNPKQLLPGLHYLGDFADQAVYCFSHESQLILVDAPGGPEFNHFLEQRLDQFGASLAGLQAVVVTGGNRHSVAGLADLVEATGCRVIAPARDHESLRRLVNAGEFLLPEDTAEAFSWFPVEPLAIDGFGPTLTGYVISWGDRRVLVSGAAPLKITREQIPILERMQFDPFAFLNSLDRVQQVQPDLWLPARPRHGQNANLYDEQWAEMMRQNRLFLGMGRG